MAIFKGTVFFEWGTNGWTENFLLDSDDKPDAITKLRSYVTQRRKSLTNYATVKYVRACDPDKVRDALFFAYTGNSGNGQFQVLNDEIGAEARTAAVNIRLFNLNGTSWRNQLVRGLPQAAIQAFTPVSIDPAWETQWRLCFAAMKAGNFRMKKETLGASSAITAIDNAFGKIISITVSVLIPGVVVGDTIRISNVINLSNANGVWRVIAINSDDKKYFLAQKPSQNLGTPALGAATAAKSTLNATVGFDTAVVVGATSRKTGRPSYVPRGKRSARKK